MQDMCVLKLKPAFGRTEGTCQHFVASGLVYNMPTNGTA